MGSVPAFPNFTFVCNMTATEAPVVSAPQVQDGKSPVKEVKKPEEVQEEATIFLTTGKRHLLVKDIPAAVSEFAQACELLSAAFGETGKECAESYYYYGKALLEMSRLESGVLGNALDGVPEEDDEANSSKVEDPSKMTGEEKKEVEEKVGEALKENLVVLEKRDDETETDETRKVETNKGDKADENKEDEDEDEAMDEGDESQEESSNEQMETDKVTKEDDEKTTGKDGEEEPSNLQLAWEMLELAKVIYTKQVEITEDETKKAIEEKLCRTILTLGEISIENENYSQAVEDIQMCLKKQGAFSKDSRLVAETHYQLGVAQGFNSQYDAAVESLNSAIQIIKERVKNINVLVKSSDGKKETGELEASIYKKEIEELEELIPEIEEKITDTQDLKKEAEKPQDAEKSSSEAKATGDVKSVSTIAVKRKAEVDKSQIKKTNSNEKTAAAV